MGARLRGEPVQALALHVRAHAHSADALEDRLRDGGLARAREPVHQHERGPGGKRERFGEREVAPVPPV
ncbi:MAG TPA: hypothetical protein VEK81_08315 [Burkholderiales bacterium]|nr:hypothetical protein [Burkholderiales bacterium]